jgi:hypothetical protein
MCTTSELEQIQLAVFLRSNPVTTKGMRYFLTRIESDLVAIGSMPQTIENVKAVLEANDVAIDRGLGVLHKSGSLKLIEVTDEGVVETILQAKWLN